jgi:glutamine amidotransferase
LVPHIGWEEAGPKKKSNIFNELELLRFYFVHSYYIKCNNEEDSLTTSSYGIVFDSSFEKENTIGVQFHPEKSHRYGKQLLKNFIELY